MSGAPDEIAQPQNPKLLLEKEESDLDEEDAEDAEEEEALETGRSVYELVLEKKWLSKTALDEVLKPENMTNPRQIPR